MTGVDISKLYKYLSINTNFIDPLEICAGPFAPLTLNPEINPAIHMLDGQKLTNNSDNFDRIA